MSQEESQVSLNPQVRFTFVVSLYMVVCMVIMVTLDLYSLLMLQKHRQYLDTLSRQVLYQPLLYPLLISSSIITGAIVGGIFGALEFVCSIPKSTFVRVFWSVLRSFLWVGFFFYHWLNTLFFDTIQNYLATLPLNPFSLLGQQGKVFYGRVLYGSMGIVIHYYSPVHVFVCFIVVVFFLLYFRWSKQLQTVWFVHRSHHVGLGVVLVFSVLLANLPGLLLASPMVRPACTSTTVSMWWMPACTRPFPAPIKPKETSANASILRGYIAHRGARKQPVSSHISQNSKHAKKPVKRPHIFLFIMESIAARHVGVYGYKKRNTTPFLNRYASNCLRFRWAFSNSNISRYGVTTLFGSRASESPMPPRDPQKRPIFPELLRKVGYVTGLFMAGYRYDQLEQYIRPRQWDRVLDSYNQRTYMLKPKAPCELDCHMVKEAQFWLLQKVKQRQGPLFMAMSLYSTHFPYTHTPRTWKPKFFRKKLDFYSPIFFPREDLPLVEAYYDDALRYVDTAQAEMIQWLKKLNLLKDSIVIFLSDHGEDLYTHGEPSHGTNLYNAQVRIPFVMCGKPFPAKWRNDNISLVDLGPTILKLANAPSHRSFEGQSLLQPAPRHPRPVFLFNKFIRKGKGVIVGPYKYIKSDSRQTEELYHIRNDPNEQENLIYQKPSISQAMRWILHDFQKRRGQQ